MLTGSRVVTAMGIHQCSRTLARVILSGVLENVPGKLDTLFLGEGESVSSQLSNASVWKPRSILRRLCLEASTRARVTQL